MHYEFPWLKPATYYNQEFGRLKAAGEFSKEGCIRVAVLGSHTLDFFSKTLAVRLFEMGVPAVVWTGPYAQIESQLVSPKSEVKEFKPDFVLVVQELSDSLGEDADATWVAANHALFKERVVGYSKRIASLVEGMGATPLISNLVAPVHSVFGSSEYLVKGERRLVMEVNLMLADAFEGLKGAALIDLDAACASAAKVDLDNERFRFMGDVRLTHKQSVMLAEEVCGSVFAFKSLSKKCIVLDLDNTLWGGIVGEDGMADIKLGQNNPIGKAFREFQKELKGLQKRGVILAVNSRNNLADVLEVFHNHSEMVLKESDFAAIKANWQDKATNLEELAKELNIGLDSMVFIDDDEFNVRLVRERLPQVTSILLPNEPTSFPLLVRTLHYFDSRSLTEEDLKRGEMYAQDLSRRKAQESSGSFEDFLASLGLALAFGEVDDFSLPRVSQLSLRTNQFNMTTKRYGEQELKDFLAMPGHKAYWMSVKDRFGEYGIIGACLVEVSGSKGVVDSFFMSCRVLGKGIENSFLWLVLGEMRKLGAKQVEAKAIATKKNTAFLDFYLKAGMSEASPREFQVNLDETHFNIPAHIKVEVIEPR